MFYLLTSSPSDIQRPDNYLSIIILCKDAFLSLLVELHGEYAKPRRISSLQIWHTYNKYAELNNTNLVSLFSMINLSMAPTIIKLPVGKSNLECPIPISISHSQLKYKKWLSLQGELGGIFKLC